MKRIITILLIVVSLFVMVSCKDEVKTGKAYIGQVTLSTDTDFEDFGTKYIKDCSTHTDFRYSLYNDESCTSASDYKFFVQMDYFDSEYKVRFIVEQTSGSFISQYNPVTSYTDYFEADTTEASLKMKANKKLTCPNGFGNGNITIEFFTETTIMCNTES